MLTPFAGRSRNESEVVRRSGAHVAPVEPPAESQFAHLRFAVHGCGEFSRKCSRGNAPAHWHHLSDNPGTAYNWTEGFVVMSRSEISTIREKLSLIILSNLFRGHCQEMVLKTRKDKYADLNKVHRGYPTDCARSAAPSRDSTREGNALEHART